MRGSGCRLILSVFVGAAWLAMGAAGADPVDPHVVLGTTCNDTITIELSDPNTVEFRVEPNDECSESGSESEHELQEIGATGVQVLAGPGTDVLVIDHGGGFVGKPDPGFPVFYDGGTTGETNRLELACSNGCPVTDVLSTYTVGATTDSGTVVQSSGDDLLSVRFAHLAPILDDVPGPSATVDASPAPNAVHLTTGSDADHAVVLIDAIERYEFSNKGALAINTLGGADVITIEPIAASGLVAVDVDAGAPTIGDALVANGTTDLDVVDVSPAAGGVVSIAGYGGPPISAVEVEELSYDGGDGDDELTYTSPAGGHSVTFEPGEASDEGRVRAGGLVPLVFSNLGGGSLTIADEAARSDRLTYNAGDGNDTVAVGADDRIAANGRIPVFTDGVMHVRVEGLAGDDRISVEAGHPFNSVTANGGTPDLGDRLLLTGASDEVTVDLPGASVAGFGGIIRFSGIDLLQTAQDGTSGTDLRVLAGNADDAVCYFPASSRSGRVTLLASPGPGSVQGCVTDPRALDVVFDFSGVAGTLSTQLGAGSDTFTLNGTAGDDTISIRQRSGAGASEMTAAVNGMKPVELTLEADDALIAAADHGRDTTDVQTARGASVRIFVDSEDPSAATAGDLLIVRDGSGRARMRDLRGREPGAGTVLVEYMGSSTSVEYVKTERIRLIRRGR